MTYYADLAGALRARKNTEAQVLDVLLTVREASTASGAAPEAEFGPAPEYAQNYTGSRNMTSAQVMYAAALVASIVTLVVLRITVFRGVELLP
jgi:hypothetical protein